MNVQELADVPLRLACPECGEEVPALVTIVLVQCECGEGHQSLGINVETIELEAHVLRHFEEES